MTRNEARTEAIVAKWDSYYDEHGGRREPRPVRHRRHQQYSAEEMLEKIRATNSKRTAVKKAVSEWQAVRAAGVAQVVKAEAPSEKVADVKPAQKPRAKRTREHAKERINQRPYNHYDVISVRYPDGREAQYKSAREAANAMGVTVATVYNCISGILHTVKGATVRVTKLEHRHNCMAVIARYADGRVVRYPSITDAAKNTGTTKLGIWRRIMGHCKTATLGIIWERAV